MIGGQDQTGEWKLNARFNKADLIRRIRKIARYKSRIRVYQLDALEFTQTVVPQLGPNTFAFYDPLYIENGAQLYLNDYEIADHKRLASAIKRLKCPWVVTYDYAAVRHEIYTAQRNMIR